MNRSRRSSSLLPHRPKTSSALDDHANSRAFHSDMKRTASQTFSPVNTAVAEVRDGEPMLGSVEEGASVGRYPPSQHSHSSSISRAGQSLKGSCKQICRRLSTSSRRPSIIGAADPPAFETSQASSSSGFPRLKLKLQQSDSGMSTPTLGENAEEPPAKIPHSAHSKLRVFRGFGSIRGHRRPATSGPSGDFARYNPSPAPIPSHYPAPAPGQAARAAAAAANNERLSKLRQEEMTSAYLDGTLQSERSADDVLKDSESGVGMSCTSPVLEVLEEPETKFDPVQHLPAEITTMILANLDAPSLIRAECVSRQWREAASSPHVWKFAFLRRFEPEIHVSPTPIMMGGAGIGKFKNGKPAPAQDWKKMYQVRMTINRRWRGCSPSAIYLNGHTDSVYCCQFDENKLITGSRDRTIRVWDLKTYKCTQILGGPTHRPILSTATPLETHRETVISHPSMNGTPEGDAIYKVPSDYHEASILCLQYDDKIMVTGSSDHTCIVWDITGDEYVPITRLERHTAGVLDVALDAKYIVSCSKDASIIIWDRTTYRPVRTLQGHRGPVNAVQLRGNLLVSASGDGIAKLWNLDSGVCIKEFPSQDRGLAAVEFSDDARYVLAGGNDHVVYKFDALTGALLHTSAKHGGLVRSLFLDAVNGRVVSGSYDQSIRIADYHTGEVFGLYENWTTSWILSAKSDYRRVVATSQDGRALILDFAWGVEGGECLVGTGTRSGNGQEDRYRDYSVVPTKHYRNPHPEKEINVTEKLLGLQEKWRVEAMRYEVADVWALLGL